MVRDVDERIANWMDAIVCSQFDLDLLLRSVDDVVHWINDPAALRGVAVIPDAAASLVDPITPSSAASMPLELAA